MVSFFSFGSIPVNLGSRASYRHDGRGPLSTDLVVMPPFKALTDLWRKIRTRFDRSDWDLFNTGYIIILRDTKVTNNLYFIVLIRLTSMPLCIFILIHLTN
jgi:hypothetical protein